jgi:hypothetical protein
MDSSQQVFMLFGLEGSGEGRLRRVSHGDLIGNVRECFRLVFAEGRSGDYEHNFFYENASDLMHYLV